MAQTSATDHVLECDLGSAPEIRMQQTFGTTARASAFRRNQVLDHLNAAMRTFVAQQAMAFIATSDADGQCDCSFRAGPPGFVRILSARRLAYPEYRGNGVLASVANMTSNPHASLLFIDFQVGKIGLHVNGLASVMSNQQMAVDPDRTSAIEADLAVAGGRRPECWVAIDIEEAYIHCSKHIPRMGAIGSEDLHWGTDDVAAKGGDYFGVASGRRAASRDG